MRQLHPTPIRPSCYLLYSTPPFPYDLSIEPLYLSSQDHLPSSIQTVCVPEQNNKEGEGEIDRKKER